MSYNIALLEASERHLGIAEWPGSQHNPEIVKMFADAGHAWVQDDETAWCAAYMASLLGEVGLQGTGKLNARSYLDWGEPVATKDAEPGDVVVLWRGDPNGWQGHVAILVRFEGPRMILRGGNQGNAVSDKTYPMQRLLGIRRADGGRSVTNRPVLKMGSRGRFVWDLQEALAQLGFHSGAKDGIFGRLTDASVRAFQAEHGLVSDGIVGRRTWAALETNPEPVEQRAVSTKDLRDRGSRQIKTADEIQKLELVKMAGAGVPVAGAAAEFQARLEATEQGLKDFEAEVGEEGLLAEMWPWLLLVVGLGLLAMNGRTIFLAVRQRFFRTEDAQTGAHLGR